MAVYRWIFSNLNLEGDRQDYQVQVMDEELRPYRDTLWDLSCRMIAGTYRNQAFRQKSWFSGFLDPQKTIYLTALSGEQEQLLNRPLEGTSRGLFCAMALGFSGKDIHLYRQDEALFEPLKQILRVRNSGDDSPAPDADDLPVHCAAYRAESSGVSKVPPKYNISRSTPETDASLWPLSLERPVLTGGVCVEEAKRLLDSFPDALTTVIEDAVIQYQGQKRISASASLLASMKADDQRREEEERRKQEALKEEERQRQERREQRQRMERRRKLLSKIYIGLWIGGGLALAYALVQLVFRGGQ